VKLHFTRRNFLTSGAGAVLTATQARGQSSAIEVGVPVKEFKPGSTVSLTSGDSQRKNVSNALMAIDDQILPKLKAKKSVLIKPNNVSFTNQLASTHADALRGILVYLAPRFKGPITIAESSGDTWAGFEAFKYQDLIKEYKSRKIDLVDLNEDPNFVPQALLEQDLHVVPVRLAAGLLDPNLFIIGSALLQSDNYTVATLSVKNMVLGAPLRSVKKSTVSCNQKASYHAGFHLIHFNMLVTAQSMQPYWGLSVIDGFEGMEGNGPASGVPVASRLAIASTDFIAADRVGVGLHGRQSPVGRLSPILRSGRTRQLRSCQDHSARHGYCLGAEEIPSELRYRPPDAVARLGGTRRRFLGRPPRGPDRRQIEHPLTDGPTARR
jgi:uncharacterized protein (DUF362 family)